MEQEGKGNVSKGESGGERSGGYVKSACEHSKDRREPETEARGRAKFLGPTNVAKIVCLFSALKTRRTFTLGKCAQAAVAAR